MSAAVDEAAAALAYATLNDPTQPPPPFAPERHAAYLKRVAADAGALEYALTEYMRVSGVYWGLTAMRLLGRDAAAELGGPALVELARGCQNADGGFGGARGHDSHVLYTLSALQVLALLGALDRCDRAAAACRARKAVATAPRAVAARAAMSPAAQPPARPAARRSFSLASS